MSTGSDPPEEPTSVHADEVLQSRSSLPALGLGDSNGPVEGNGEEDAASTDSPRRGRIPHHMLQVVALMVVNGASYESIATSTGLPHDTLQRLVTEGANKRFNKYVEAYREKVLKATSFHQMKLMDMLDHAYIAVQRGLGSEDDKLAVDTAFKLMDRVVPNTVNQQAAMEVNVGFQNVHLENQVHTTFKAVSGKIESLMGRLLSDDPERYLRDDAATYEIPVESTTIEPTPTDDAEPN